MIPSSLSSKLACSGRVKTTIPAVVDTGFSGYVCLSRYRIEAMDLEFSYVDRYELADGTVVAKDVFAGRAEFDGQVLDVDVILTDSADTLIGASIMKRHVLTVDYTSGIVRLEPPASKSPAN